MGVRQSNEKSQPIVLLQSGDEESTGKFRAAAVETCAGQHFLRSAGHRHDPRAERKGVRSTRSSVLRRRCRGFGQRLFLNGFRSNSDEKYSTISIVDRQTMSEGLSGFPSCDVVRREFLLQVSTVDLYLYEPVANERTLKHVLHHSHGHSTTFDTPKTINSREQIFKYEEPGNIAFSSRVFRLQVLSRIRGGHRSTDNPNVSGSNSFSSDFTWKRSQLFRADRREFRRTKDFRRRSKRFDRRVPMPVDARRRTGKRVRSR